VTHEEDLRSAGVSTEMKAIAVLLRTLKMKVIEHEAPRVTAPASVHDVYDVELRTIRIASRTTEQVQKGRSLCQPIQPSF
jgi:hypothetical protein